MTTRRRWGAGLALGFLGLGIVVCALNSRSKQPDVRLLFIGYTDAVDPLAYSVEKAVLLVTNCGSVPVQVLPLWEAWGRTNMDAHRHSYVLVFGRVLKPSESVRAELRSGFDEQMLRAEVAYHRLDFRHRLSQRVHSSTNTVARAVARLLPRQPKPRWARSELLTYDPLAPPNFAKGL